MNGATNFLRIPLPRLMHHHRHALARGGISAREIVLAEWRRVEEGRARWRELLATTPTTERAE